MHPPVLMKIPFSVIGTTSIATYLPTGHRSLLPPSAGPKKSNKGHFHCSSGSLKEQELIASEMSVSVEVRHVPEDLLL